MDNIIDLEALMPTQQRCVTRCLNYLPLNEKFRENYYKKRKVISTKRKESRKKKSEEFSYFQKRVSDLEQDILNELLKSFNQLKESPMTTQEKENLTEQLKKVEDKMDKTLEEIKSELENKKEDVETNSFDKLFSEEELQDFYKKSNIQKRILNSVIENTVFNNKNVVLDKYLTKGILPNKEKVPMINYTLAIRDFLNRILSNAFDVDFRKTEEFKSFLDYLTTKYLSEIRQKLYYGLNRKYEFITMANLSKLSIDEQAEYLKKLFALLYYLVEKFNLDVSEI